MLAFLSVCFGIVALVIGTGLARKLEGGGTGTQRSLWSCHILTADLLHGPVLLISVTAVVLWGCGVKMAVPAMIVGLASALAGEWLEKWLAQRPGGLQRLAQGQFAVGIALVSFGCLYSGLGWPGECWALLGVLLAVGMFAGLRCMTPVGPVAEGRGLELPLLLFVCLTGILATVLCGAVLPAPEEGLKLWYMSSGPGLAVLGAGCGLIGFRSMEYLSDESRSLGRRKALVVVLSCFVATSFIFSLVSPGFSLWAWLAGCLALSLALAGMEWINWLIDSGKEQYAGASMIVCLAVFMLIAFGLSQSGEELYTLCLCVACLISVLPFTLGISDSPRAQSGLWDIPVFRFCALLAGAALAAVLLQKLGSAALLSGKTPGAFLWIWALAGVAGVSAFSAAAAGCRAPSRGCLAGQGMVLGLAALLLWSAGPAAQAGVVLGGLGALSTLAGVGPKWASGGHDRGALIIFVKLLCIISLFIAPIAWQRG